MRLNVCFSDISEWHTCSFNWHWVIRYSDRVSWVIVQQRVSDLHPGWTITAIAVRETMASSNSRLNSGDIGILAIKSAFNSVCAFSVASCKQCSYSPPLYAYTISKSVVTILATELNFCAWSWRYVLRCSTAACCNNSTSSDVSLLTLLADN